ncbi:hypothetical protein GUITHDRAFT_154108 [Guillardia theta CCMP2712]|uniref:Uncharacterized protein n=1 Tax=Guillardia theta (strain CCMP2712) TaxID=905079 RepID=L1IWW0_GUITC|nr:hypothetical protein GUITHDRAFT_154108 [Guillardia theta CCMP2712]EKX40602.1 hypothetical protein GUITHDRAFT_154108 [Guillardia theta CCMP2712]|eukprot:XP_005827582.1 hypothetical protein GUITHDRAFT_154108 [Guillardia theta CCMP2712]
MPTSFPFASMPQGAIPAAPFMMSGAPMAFAPPPGMMSMPFPAPQPFPAMISQQQPQSQSQQPQQPPRGSQPPQMMGPPLFSTMMAPAATASNGQLLPGGIHPEFPQLGPVQPYPTAVTPMDDMLLARLNQIPPQNDGLPGFPYIGAPFIGIYDESKVGGAQKEYEAPADYDDEVRGTQV